MRGPTANTAAAEEIETAVPFDEAVNETLSNHVICSRSVSNASSKVRFRNESYECNYETPVAGTFCVV